MERKEIGSNEYTHPENIGEANTEIPEAFLRAFPLESSLTPFPIPVTYIPLPNRNIVEETSEESPRKLINEW